MENETSNTNKIIYVLFILATILMAIGDYLESNFSGMHISITLGIIIIVGLSWHKIPMKEAFGQLPTGIKLITIYYFIVSVSNIVGSLAGFRAADIFFGIPLAGPVTAITQALPLLAVLLIITYILKQKHSCDGKFICVL
jgi:hypothetical protein